MIKLPLANGGYALIDSEDVKQTVHKWHKSSLGYVVRGNGIYLHREIIGETELNIDHISRNKLDNRRENLRLCDRSQNQANRNMPKNNTSGFKGVSWSKREKKWHARVAAYGRRYSLGLHNSAIEAARIYNEKVIELFGEFAVINVIEEVYNDGRTI